VLECAQRAGVDAPNPPLDPESREELPMSKPIELPSVDYLNECFLLDLVLWLLIWRERPLTHFLDEADWATWNRCYAGKVAGFVHKSHGYRIVSLNNRNLRAHRIIWKMTKGTEPPDMVDHINRRRSDNRPDNFRPANEPQQNWNSESRPLPVSGYRGVYPLESGRYRARIWIKGKCHHLGNFATAEEAHEAYEAAARKLHGEYYVQR
jgi:hypothetical protein